MGTQAPSLSLGKFLFYIHHSVPTLWMAAVQQSPAPGAFYSITTARCAPRTKHGPFDFPPTPCSLPVYASSLDSPLSNTPSPPF